MKYSKASLYLPWGIMVISLCHLSFYYNYFEPLFASLSLIQNDWNCINVSIQIAPIKKQKEKKGYAMNQSFKKPRWVRESNWVRSSKRLTGSVMRGNESYEQLTTSDAGD